MDDHKKWIGEVFDRTAPQYGKKSSSFFTYFGNRLVEQIDIRVGQHILDVATGKGAVLFPAAQAAGPSGKVIGIDISRQMLVETAQEIKTQNILGVDLLHMDAEHLNFPDHSFDVVFCGFALFFLPSIPAALAEFKRVLKPGGKLAVSTWGNDSELDEWLGKETKKLSCTQSLIINPLWSERELQKVLNDAGFNSIKIIEETKAFSHNTPEEWWESLWTHAIRGKLEQLEPEQLLSLQNKAIEKAHEMGHGQRFTENLQVFYGIAQKG